MAREFKIFISHCWNYHDDLIKLRNLLERRGYFNVEFLEATVDAPINSLVASYVKKALKKKIISSHIVLAIGGVYASYSDWMSFELDTAYSHDVPIICIAPLGQVRISKMVQDYSEEVVRWSTESIVRAIRLHSIK